MTTKYAYIFGRIEPQREQEVIAQLRKLAFVEEAYLVFGRYDLITKITCTASEDLFKLRSEIAGISGIRQLSMLPLCSDKVYKAKNPILRNWWGKKC